MIINEISLMKQIDRLTGIRIMLAASETPTAYVIDVLGDSIRVCEFALKALKLERIAQGMVNKCNAVTAFHRHGSTIDDESLIDLYDRQLETEAALQEYRNGQRTNKSTEGTTT